MTNRRTSRVNYRILNSTGEISHLPVVDLQSTAPEVEFNPPSFDLNQPSFKEMASSELVIEKNVILHEINNIIDENPIHPDYASNKRLISIVVRTVSDCVHGLRTILFYHPSLSFVTETCIATFYPDKPENNYCLIFNDTYC